MSNAAVKFDILAKDRASDKFSKVGNSADQTRSKFALLGKAGKLAALGLGAGLVLAAGAAVKFTKAAIADEASAKRMAQQFKTSANATKGQIAATEKWITTQGRAKGVADDDLRPALSSLVRATGDVGKAQKLASLAMDVSAGTGKDLGAVSTALAKAQNGNVGALARLGVKTKDAEGKTMSFKKVVGQLGETFKGAASKHAETTAGRFERLKLIGSELGESIGAKLLPPITAFAGFLLNKVGPAISKVGGWVNTHLVPPLKAFGQFVTGSVMPALARLGGLIAARVSPILQTMGEVFRTRIAPTLAIVKAKFTEMQPALSKVGGFLGKVAVAAFKVGAFIHGLLIKSLIRLGGAIFSKVVPALVTIVGGLVRGAAKVIDFGRKLVGGVKAASAFARGIAAKVGAAMDFLGSIPGKVKKVFTNAGTWLRDAGRKIISGLIDGIKSAFGKLKAKLKEVTDAIPKWKGPIGKDAKLLVPAGRAIMGGLIGSIGDQTPALRRQLASVTDMVSQAGGSVNVSASGTAAASRGGSSASGGYDAAFVAALAAALAQALGSVEFRAKGSDLVGVLSNHARVRGIA